MTGNKGTAASGTGTEGSKEEILLPERRPEPEVMEHLTLADVL